MGRLGHGYRTLAVALMTVALLLPPQGAGAASAPFQGFFRDVPPVHWAFQPVNWLYLRGVVRGYEDGYFRPGLPVSRAELAKMALLARGITIADQCVGRFADVPCASWFGPAVELAHRVAFFDVPSGGQFNPLGPVTRQEAMQVLVRAMGKFMDARGHDRSSLAGFSDWRQLSSAAIGAAAWLAGNGLVAGDGNGRLRPGDPVTRAEMAAWLYRTLQDRPGERSLAIVDNIPVHFIRTLDVISTMYATGEPGVGTMTYSSLPVRVGIVATDPAIIPLGTQMYVPGYGYAVAADTGGAVKGNHIDLYTEDYEQAAKRYGVRPLTVYLLD